MTVQIPWTLFYPGIHMLQSRLAIVDTETTGTSIIYDRIIEIGVVIVENGTVIKKFETFINPERTIPEFISNITGIHQQDLENAPTFFQVKEELEELFKGALFVAHNARFDHGFFKSEFGRIGMNFQPKTLCTVRVSRKFYPEYQRHNLDEIIRRFGLQCLRRHRALDDALVLVDFLKIITENFTPEIIQDNLQKLLGKAAVPPALSAEFIDGLPGKTGVYIFYDDLGFPLYVGKSLNIKERIQSHFSASLRESKEMKIFHKVHHIETMLTCGELGALLLESAMIKKLQPLYNRRLRKMRRLSVMKSTMTPEGYASISIEQVEHIDAMEIENIYGLFRSKKQAEKYLEELSKEYTLCLKLLQLEKTKGSCFGYQLKRCKGACTQEEEPSSYNTRFHEAFQKSRLHPWKYPGIIAVEEKDESNGTSEIFFVDQWCLIAKGKLTEFGLEMQDQDAVFDIDSYKILVKQLIHPRKKQNLRYFTREEFNLLRES